jgi:hypothetical protein
MNVIEGDVLACYEFSDSRCSKRPQTPEYRLMYEVLVDALRTLGSKKIHDHNGSKEHLRLEKLEAKDWLMDQGGFRADATYSIDTVCSVLGIDVGALRLAVLAGRLPRISPRRTGTIRENIIRPKRVKKRVTA